MRIPEVLSSAMRPLRPSLVNRLIETDYRGRVVYATPEAARVLGTTTRDLMGADLLKVAPGRDLRELLRIAIMGAVSASAAVTLPPTGQQNRRTVHFSAERLDARKVRWRILTDDEM